MPATPGLVVCLGLFAFCRFAFLFLSRTFLGWFLFLCHGYFVIAHERILGCEVLESSSPEIHFAHHTAATKEGGREHIRFIIVSIEFECSAHGFVPLAIMRER